MKWDKRAGRKGSGRVSIKRATRVGSRRPLVEAGELGPGLLLDRPAKLFIGIRVMVGQ